MPDESAAAVRDVQEIQLAKARYCAASDTMDAAKALAILGDVLHADLTADYTAVQFESKAALTQFLAHEITGTAEWIWHSLHTPLIEVDGDKARGEWTVLLRIRRKGEASPGEMVGRYVDRFLKVDGKWQILSIHFENFV